MCIALSVTSFSESVLVVSMQSLLILGTRRKRKLIDLIDTIHETKEENKRGGS